MSMHMLDIGIAVRVGVNAAILYQNILFWTEKNAANDKHFHDGKYWTYNSKKAFEIQFPYLSGKQIRTAIDRLRDNGLIVTGNYNTSSYDRTLWYSPVEKSLSPTGPMENPPKPATLAPEGQPIPDSKPDIKPDKKDSVSEFDQFLEISPSKEGRVKAFEAFKKVREKVSFETLIDGIQGYSEACKRKKTPKDFFLHPANWLIDERWTDEPDQPCAKSPAAKSGDRSALSSGDLELLTTKILPQARQNLAIPGRADTAKKTLQFWGEPI